MLQLNDLLSPEGWESNWTIYGAQHEGLPDDAEYVVFEYYCATSTCDCENVVADIMRIGSDGRHIEKSLASFNYNWSTKETACKPTFHSNSPRTQLAQHLLEAYKSFVHDPEYLQRIKRDYARVKELSAARLANRNMPKINQNKKIGRNDPCECGSGKKHKKCCLVET
jgi:hypothetical protein